MYRSKLCYDRLVLISAFCRTLPCNESKFDILQMKQAIKEERGENSAVVTVIFVLFLKKKSSNKWQLRFADNFTYVPL